MSSIFKTGVQLTPLAWETAVAWTAADSVTQPGARTSLGQRWATVLHAAALAIEAAAPDTTEVSFETYLVPRDGVSTQPQRVVLCVSRNASGVIIHLEDECLEDVGLELAGAIAVA